MNKKVGLLFAILPVTSKFRGNLYKILSRGDIKDGFKIGFGSYIDAASIKIGKGCTIGNMVRMKFLDEFVLGDGSSIGSSTIVCGSCEQNKFHKRCLKIGSNTDILCSHYFDVVAPISIGDHVTVAGKWSQFYTHSFDLQGNRMDGSINMGNKIYIGAGCIVNLGVRICDKVVCQGGTVINHDITEPGVYMSHTFARRGSVRDFHEYKKDCPFRENENGTICIFKE